MKFAVFFLSIFFAAHTQANQLFARLDRESSVGINLSLAKEFGSLDLYGNIGLSDLWRIFIRANETKSISLISKEFRIGADLKVGEHFLPRAALISRTEPGQIQGGGLNLGFDYGVQHLWDGELKTLLIFDLESIRYFQKTESTQVAARLPKEEVLNQSSLTLGVGQVGSPGTELEFAL